ncbi:MAG: SDR family oxidoreductase [Burkholderiaceae bacterium]|jgi:NAD(P)-dependent dehydrogenase (short-subunit alcohol dehydrogenase family)
MTASPAPSAAIAADRPVALVTGAARRIGRAIAEELASKGWRLALHHRRSAEDISALCRSLEARGASVAIVQADLDSEEQTRNLGTQVLQRFGRWDAVVNNASLFEYDEVGTFTYARLEQHLRANTAAPVVLAQALHAHRRSAHPGAVQTPACVVNLLDQKLWNPNPDYLSYTLSKAALEAANTLLAQALAPLVRVCGVAPGVTLVSGPMSEQGFEQAHTMTPLGRSSTPEDIARAVDFLLQSPAITGTTLLVDGGQHLSAQARDVLFLTPAPPPLRAAPDHS